MSNKWIWVVSPAIFSTIGLIAGRLTDHSYTLYAATGGLVLGLLISTFAVAGEKD